MKIQSTGFLLRKINDKNFSISQNGICFEKYDKHGTYGGMNSADFIEYSIRRHCEAVCRTDQSPEGVILRITGKELKKLGCPIYADWNKPFPLKRTSDYIPQDVNYDASVI